MRKLPFSLFLLLALYFPINKTFKCPFPFVKVPMALRVEANYTFPVYSWCQICQFQAGSECLKCLNPIGLPSTHNNHPNTTMKSQRLDTSCISAAPFFLDCTDFSCGQSSLAGQNLQPAHSHTAWVSVCFSELHLIVSTWRTKPAAFQVEATPTTEVGGVAPSHLNSSFQHSFDSSAMFVIQFSLDNVKYIFDFFGGGIFIFF